MTNGCFDILHAGHVAYLEEAKQRGDRLLVAVNDDASVARLKGAGRPINPLADRMAVLAGLAAVDWVVPFGEDTPEALICEVLPDVLVKGGDYRPENIAGARAVLANGGTVEVLSFQEGRSTSSYRRGHAAARNASNVRRPAARTAAQLMRRTVLVAARLHRPHATCSCRCCSSSVLAQPAVPGYRRRIGERFGFGMPRLARSSIWVHAVSVGEVQAAAPLVRALLKRHPGVPLVLTTMTPTGSERVRALFGDAVVHSYVPYDLAGAGAPVLRLGAALARDHHGNRTLAEPVPRVRAAAGAAGAGQRPRIAALSSRTIAG